MAEYTILSFGRMIEDKERTTAYSEALKKLITPDSVVLDIGAGTGVFSILAALYGAKKVYAVEPNDSIQVAMDLAKVNGVADRIEFIQDVTQKLSLPEKADIIVADIHGTLPFYSNLLETFADANERLIKPSGVMLPSRDDMYVMPVASNDFAETYDLVWAKANLPINWTGVAQYNYNTSMSFKAGSKDVSTSFSPAHWATLDYQQMRRGDTFKYEQRVAWTCEQPTQRIDGYALWFESTLTDEIRLSNDPRSTPLVYGILYLPLLEPVTLVQGQEIALELRNSGLNQDVHWHWNTTIGATENTPERKFRQSTLYSTAVTLKTLNKTHPDRVFSVTDDGRLAIEVLTKLDAGWSLGKLAAHLHHTFPERFKSAFQARDFITPITAKYTDS